jgi:hypothetical protein
MRSRQSAYNAPLIGVKYLSFRKIHRPGQGRRPSKSTHIDILAEFKPFAKGIAYRLQVKSIRLIYTIANIIPTNQTKHTITTDKPTLNFSSWMKHNLRSHQLRTKRYITERYQFAIVDHRYPKNIIRLSTCTCCKYSLTLFTLFARNEKSAPEHLVFTASRANSF